MRLAGGGGRARRLWGRIGQIVGTSHCFFLSRRDIYYRVLYGDKLVCMETKREKKITENSTQTYRQAGRQEGRPATKLTRTLSSAGSLTPRVKKQPTQKKKKKGAEHPVT